MKLRSRKLTKTEEGDVGGGIWTRRTILLLVGILVLFAVLIGGLYRYSSSSTGPFRQRYEGRIVEKWAGYSESELGSHPYFRLLIEDDENVRFAVAVTPEIYDRAKAGMRIKKTDDGTELLIEESKINSAEK